MNAWVKVALPDKSVALGVDRDNEPEAVLGFRPARGIISPATPYELQAHEVTWSEIEPWAAGTHTEIAIPTWAADAKARASLPVAGVMWTVAREYCRSVGGDLPTEEQWEYAARGPKRRKNSWGNDPVDRSLTRVYGGVAATPAAVKSSPQDQTPGPAIYDLIGNVQEWTLGLWREDSPDDPSNPAPSDGDIEVRAIRGLPLGVDAPWPLPPDAAAYRERLCAAGACVAKAAELRPNVGFRCARAAK